MLPSIILKLSVVLQVLFLVKEGSDGLGGEEKEGEFKKVRIGKIIGMDGEKRRDDETREFRKRRFFERQKVEKGRKTCL